MFRAFWPVLLIPAIALSACSKAPTNGDSAPASPPAADVAGKTKDAIQPRIAYDYHYGFRLPTDAVGGVQEQHVALCDRAGAGVCRVIGMERSQTRGDEVFASLKLQIAAEKARSFGASLIGAVDGAKGKVTDTSIKATDLSKDMVDTAARIKAKEAVVDRLTTILRTRTGNVDQLVTAERAIGDAQEQLDAARAWMAEAQSRVTMSTIEIDYQSTGVAGGAFAKLGNAFGTSAELFTSSLSALIQFLIILAPWLALAGLALLGRARFRRWQARRQAVNDAA